MKREIMERNQTGKILQDIKTLWEKTLASLTEAVFIVDPVTRTIVACNPAVENIFGYAEEEVIGRNTEFLHPNRELYEEFGRNLFPALDANGVFHTEHQVRSKDGSILMTEHTVTEIVDDSGNRIGLVSVVRDITERKRVEKLLKENHELLESIFSSINFLVAYMDTDFNFIRVNRAYADADGRPPEFFVGKNHFDLYPHEGNEAIFRKVVETGEPYFAFEKPFEYPERPGIGVTYWDWSLIPMRERGREVDGLVLGLVNVTERKRAEQALRESTRQLQILSSKLVEAHESERKHFARELHDSIGGRLAAIKFSLARKLDQMRGGEVSSGILLEDIISMVQSTIEEARRISTDLRPSILDDFGVIATIDWFCQEFERIYPGIRIGKEIGIEETEVPERLKIPVFRVFQEVMNNIAQHSNANFASLHFGKVAGSIELAIEDNGQGFDMEEVLSKKRLEVHMGLSAMKERAELSGGAFSIESIKGRGTTVRARWKINEH
jgi:PAS domain S-box-containing protein